MKKLSILVLLVIGLLVFVGCDGEIDVNTTLDWTDVATEWTNDDGDHLNYVTQDGDTWIDLGWYNTPGDENTYVMCFIENFTVADNVLTGVYDYDEDEEDTWFDVVITFTYNETTETLSFTCSGEGVLDGKSFSFTPDTGE